MTASAEESAAGRISGLNTGSPWHFLRPLSGNRARDRALIELTRKEELDIVDDMIAAARVSLLYAFSGNGKTSLLDAGIIPRLRDRDYVVFKTRPRPPGSIGDPCLAVKRGILQGIEIPVVSSQLLRDLEKAKAEISSEAESLPKIAELLGRIAGALRRPLGESDVRDRLETALHRSIHEFVKEVRSVLGIERQTMLLICDQFEELFVHYGNTPEMNDFISEIGDLWADDSIDLHILFSMREDWVGSMIEFRRRIPEIFAYYYKLNPLTRSRAALALTEPFRNRPDGFTPEAQERILDDLVDSYSETQRDRFSEVNLTRSPVEDPYLELPALQVLADALWATRHLHPEPLSLNHYESLPSLAHGDAEGVEDDSPQTSDSPAEWILDHYLTERLDEIKDPPDFGLSDGEWKEMRIDCMYLLTDRSRHRRALTETALLEQLSEVRSPRLGLPAVDSSLLEKALAPLVERRLVSRYPVPGEQTQYELSHDFAVRAVIRSWREQDRRRTADLAVREQRISTLERRDRRFYMFLRGLPLIWPLFLALIFSLLFVEESKTAVVTVAWLSLFPFAVTLVVGGLVRHVSSTILAGGAILGLAVVVGLVNQAEPALSTYSFNGSPNLVGQTVQGIKGELAESYRYDYDYFGVSTTATQSEFLVEADGELSFELLDKDGYKVLAQSQARRAAEDSGELSEDSFLPSEYSWTASISYSFSEPGVYYLLISGRRASYRIDLPSLSAEKTEPSAGPMEIESDYYMTESEPNDWHRSVRPVYRGSEDYFIAAVVVLLTAVFLLFASTFNALEIGRRLRESRLHQRTLAVLWAELVDFALLAALAAVGLGVVNLIALSGAELDSAPYLTLSSFLALLVISYVWITTWSLRRYGATPGLMTARLSVATVDGSPTTFRQALTRQLRFLFWAAICGILFLVPWLLIGSLVLRYNQRHQPLYDLLGDTEVHNREPGAEEPVTAKDVASAS